MALANALFIIRRAILRERFMSVKRNAMEPIVLALASNERYFPGLYCAVASALSHLDAARELNLKVLDGGISQTSRDTARAAR